MESDETTHIATAVLDAARKRGLRIVTAESCTGGLVGAALTAVPGASDVFDRGLVTYSYTSKTELLGVSAEMLGTFGAVSEPVAGTMAQGALAGSGRGIAIATTGVAGPGASETKPEGLVWFGLAINDQVHCEAHNFGPLGRDRVRELSVRTALTIALRRITEQP